MLRDDTNVGEELLVTARSLFGATVEDLVAARAREGASAAGVARAAMRCVWRRWLRRCAAACPRSMRGSAPSSNERLAELQVNVDRDRLEQELALMLQRLDVDEELDRLSRPHRGDPPDHQRQ